MRRIRHNAALGLVLVATLASLLLASTGTAARSARAATATPVPQIRAGAASELLASSDGASVLVKAMPVTNAVRIGAPGQIWAVTDAGTTATKLGSGQLDGISADGQRVAWLSGNEEDFAGHPARTGWVSDADSSHERAFQNVRELELAPNGAAIVGFYRRSAVEGAVARLGFLPASGTGYRPLRLTGAKPAALLVMPTQTMPTPTRSLGVCSWDISRQAHFVLATIDPSSGVARFVSLPGQYFANQGWVNSGCHASMNGNTTAVLVNPKDGDTGQEYLLADFNGEAKRIPVRTGKEANVVSISPSGRYVLLDGFTSGANGYAHYHVVRVDLATGSATGESAECVPQSTAWIGGGPSSALMCDVNNAGRGTVRRLGVFAGSSLRYLPVTSVGTGVWSIGSGRLIYGFWCRICSWNSDLAGLPLSGGKPTLLMTPVIDGVQAFDVPLSGSGGGWLAYQNQVWRLDGADLGTAAISFPPPAPGG